MIDISCWPHHAPAVGLVALIGGLTSWMAYLLGAADRRVEARDEAMGAVREAAVAELGAEVRKRGRIIAGLRAKLAAWERYGEESDQVDAAWRADVLAAVATLRDLATDMAPDEPEGPY